MLVAPPTILLPVLVNVKSGEARVAVSLVLIFNPVPPPVPSIKTPLAVAPVLSVVEPSTVKPSAVTVPVTFIPPLSVASTLLSSYHRETSLSANEA